VSVTAIVQQRYRWNVRPRLRKSAAKMIRSFAALPSVSVDDVSVDVPVVAPILGDICMPPFYGPRHDDYTPLMRIAGTLQPKLIVELGTAYGNSVANLCRQCPEARVVTVNAPVEEQSGETTTFELATHDIGRVYRNYGFAARVTQLFQNTLELDLSAHVALGTVDLAIVDACHDAEFVANDFLKIEPYVRSGGVVLLHDTHPEMSGHLWGSYVACVGLRRRGYDIRHIEETWWGIWRKP
jgi:predicted O-methyltransferase YrrM